MAQSIERASEQNWPPLVCICSLCECGGHKCSDFNDWLAAQDRGSTTPLGGGGGGGGGGDDARPSAERPNGHSCSYTRAAALDERYLSRPSAASPQQQRPPRPKRGAREGDTPKEPSTRSATPAARGAQSGGSLEQSAEVLRVLVTRPQVASKPRDNIIFEGDMDLRTTFETSYEALARARLEHWKRHQELRAQRQRNEANGWQDVSDTADGDGQRAKAAAISRSPGAGQDERADSVAGQFRCKRAAEDDNERATRSVDDVGGGPAGSRRARGSAIDASGTDAAARNRPTNAIMEHEQPTRPLVEVCAVDRSGESKQRRELLVSGQALSPGGQPDGPAGEPASHRASPRPPADLTTEQRRQQQHRRQQDHFIDPDLSPIIIYDANLNRLERVGLRKRSKYRPSTSLRPGGRGFFGPVEAADDQEAELDAQKSATALGPTEQMSTDDRRYEKRGAHTSEPDDTERIGLRAAAGASSVTLNRDQSDCGRKHNHGHVNRIDHIKQMNLVESSDSRPSKLADSATSTDDGNVRATQGQLERAADDGRCTDFIEDGQKTGSHEDETRIALEEEAAAVAEIQRLVVTDDEYRVAHRVEPQQQASPSSRQSNRLIKQATISSPSEAVTLAASARAQTNSPVSTQGAGRGSSRYSRMERVCQNQSFYLFENDYPETKVGALDDKYCIKIGGRETVDLSRQLRGATPQSAYVRQNLFRESPDFILTTGHMQTHQQLVKNQLEQQRHSAEPQNETPESNGNQTQHRTIKLNQESEESEHRIENPISDVHKCRVLNLGREFEFVGSRSGHKYFVEKHTVTTPMSELG